jgi:hypothetical protein
MKPGQIAQLQELERCYIAYPQRWQPDYRRWLDYMILGLPFNIQMTKLDKKWLRRLWHQYRHQIAAMRKNRKA